MWYVNLQTKVRHECSEDYFNKYYAKDDDYQRETEGKHPEIEDAVIVRKTKKELITEAKALGVKGADRMSVEELNKAVE